MEIYNPQENHEKLVNAINKAYGEQIFKIKSKPVSISNPISSKSILNEINPAVRLIVNTLNLTGGSVGDADIYNLLRKYICDEDVRKSINKII